MTNWKLMIKGWLKNFLLLLRFLFAATLIWRTAPLLTGSEAIGLEHNLPGALVLLIALWAIVAAALFALPRGLSWSAAGLLWGSLGLLALFLIVAAFPIYVGAGLSQLIVYASVVVGLLAGERWLRAEPPVTYF